MRAGGLAVLVFVAACSSSDEAGEPKEPKPEVGVQCPADCDGTPCKILCPVGEYCCVSLHACRPTIEGECSIHYLACDGPEDCAPGEHCFYMFGDNIPRSWCAGVETCGDSYHEDIACHSVDDCPPCFASCEQGYDVKTCRRPPPACDVNCMDAGRP